MSPQMWRRLSCAMGAVVVARRGASTHAGSRLGLRGLRLHEGVAAGIR